MPGYVQILPNTDRWAAIGEKVGEAIGKGYTDQTQYNDASKFLTDYKAKTEAANQLQSDYDRSQREAVFANKYLALKKNWDDNSAGGTLSDELKQSIINQSRALRQEATANGYNLLGEDTDYNTARIKNYDDQNSRIAQIAAGLGKMNIDASKFLPQRDMGHDVGASQRPTYDQSASLSGLGNLVNQQYGKYADPATYKAAATDYYASHDMSPDTLKRIAPMLQAQQDELNNSKSIQLIAQIQNTNDPTTKAVLMQQYQDLRGKDGLGFLKDLTPQQKSVQWNNGGQQGIDMVTTPSTLGTGGAGVTNLQTRDNTLNPGQVQQGQEFTAKMSQDDKHFYANLNLQAQKLQNDMSNDAARIQLAQKNGALSGFGTLLSDLRGRASNALRGAQEVITAHKNNYEENYNPQNDSEVQRYMQDYQAYSKQADTISNQLGAAMGLNVSGQGNSAKQDPVAKMIDQAKASNYSKEQILDMLHNKGYNEYDSYVW